MKSHPTPASRFGPLALVAALLGPSSVAFACSSCGCTLSSDWASQGLSAKRGLDVDLRVDTLRQDDLRSGTRRVSRRSLPVPSEQEVQLWTANRDTTLTIDEGLDDDWGVTLQVPFHDRRHATIAEGDDAPSTSASSGLGDVRLTARYQGFSQARDWGVQFGLEAPTGGTGIVFRDGPRAGEPLDRGLQPGTGSTDLLLGAFRFGSLGTDLDYAVQATTQVPLTGKDGFRPGIGTNLTAGVRYLSDGPIVPHVQLNLRMEGRERGVNADVANSGSTLLYFSPGATWALKRELQAYAFVQVPVYQRVNGLQIEPRYGLSAGLRYAP